MFYEYGARGSDMSSTYSGMDTYRQTRRPNPTGFFLLVILAAAVCAVAVYMGGAPIKSLFPEDWIGWGRTSLNWAIALGAGAFVLLISVLGTLVTSLRFLLSFAPAKKPAVPPYLSSPSLSSDFRPVAPPKDTFPDLDLAPFPAVNMAPLKPVAAPSAPVAPAPAPLAAPVAVTPEAVVSDSGIPDSRVQATVAPAVAQAPVPSSTAPSSPLPSAPVPSNPVSSAPGFGHGLDLHSLEPAVFPDPATFSDPKIFSDNASDSFLTRPAAETVASQATAFDPVAALSDTHGLHVAPHVDAPLVKPAKAEPVSAQIIQLHPAEPVPEIGPEVGTVSASVPASDPLEAALLADGPVVEPRHIPPSDINAVISSAMRFINASEAPKQVADAAPAPENLSENLSENIQEKIYESLPGGADTAFVPSAPTLEQHTPDPQAETPAPFPALAVEPVGALLDQAEAVPEATPVQEASPAPEIAPAFDHEAEIRQVAQTVLSVWPDATRSIAADELGVRLSRLYHDPAPESQKAFKLLASGDISAAANVIAAHADSLDAAARNSEAAELWRIYGALHMGRDDPKALLAYEHVSELDPSDANIHVYLARRYMMAGDTLKQPAVISRALAVVTDPATRGEFLPTYADLKLKAGDHKMAADALEELSRLQETATYLKPDDVAAKSAYAITVARLAQAREMSGQYAEASPMYMKAYQAFSLLSQQKPDHAGLKAMAENALKDYNRLTQTAAL